MISPVHRIARSLLSVVVLVAATAAVVAPAAAAIGVVVRAEPGADVHVARTLHRMGGEIGTRLPLIDGFAATIPASSVDRARAIPGVVAVTPDASLRLMHSVDGFDGATDPGSSFNLAKTIRSHDLWKSGITGRGVDIAMIDSGVLPVNGLTYSGKIVNGPDLSFESQASNLRFMDTYGHGTHLAGIIGGRDDAATSLQAMTGHDTFTGVAPEARIVNIKVANAHGATDVSQVLAAIDWVVQNRNAHGLNIRVMNLAFGTDSTQDRRLDPLSYAVEVAWRRGIAVVVAAGNDGRNTVGLANPARNPFVIAVGADDSKGTYEVEDDTIPAWSSRGDGVRNPDLVAPGKSLVSLRAPGTYIDQQFPGGRASARFFRGSGTSQAAAVVSGAAALLIQQRPSITPDQLKALLTSTATSVPLAPATAQGAGLLNLKSAAAAPTPNVTQTWTLSAGTGSLEQARGSAHVVDENGNVLEGEQDIFGKTWDGTTWSAGAWNGTTWSGGEWLGTTWSGNCLCVQTWSGMGWAGTTWSGTTWSGTTWSGTTWSGTTWSGTTWSGTTWSGTTWSGTTWSGTTWSGTTWSSAAWE